MHDWQFFFGTLVVSSIFSAVGWYIVRAVVRSDRAEEAAAKELREWRKGIESKCFVFTRKFDILEEHFHLDLSVDE